MTFDIDRSMTLSVERSWVQRDPDYGDNAKYIDPNAPRSPAPPQSSAAKVPPLETFDMDDPEVRRRDFVRRLIDLGYDRDIVEKKADYLITNGYTPEDFGPRVRPDIDQAMSEKFRESVPSVTDGQTHYKPYRAGTLFTPLLTLPRTQEPVTFVGGDITSSTVSEQSAPALAPAPQPPTSEPKKPSVKEMQAEEERRHRDFMKEISPVRRLFRRFIKADGPDENDYSDLINMYGLEKAQEIVREMKEKDTAKSDIDRAMESRQHR